MAEKKLQLTVGRYDQPQLDKDGNFDRDKGLTTTRANGDVFKAQSQEEYDRLTSLGAAIDPDKANASEAEKLRARLSELETERQQAEAKLAATESAAPALDASDLKGKELDDALDARGLSTEGKVEDKRARLSEALSGNPENPNAHTGA
jgi:predicted  nucleic acid-binding Zn-ribbon protein